MSNPLDVKERNRKVVRLELPHKEVLEMTELEEKTPAVKKHGAMFEIEFTTSFSCDYVYLTEEHARELAMGILNHLDFKSFQRKKKIEELEKEILKLKTEGASPSMASDPSNGSNS